jgi:hypothetical protein
MKMMTMGEKFAKGLIQKYEYERESEAHEKAREKIFA